MKKIRGGIVLGLVPTLVLGGCFNLNEKAITQEAIQETQDSNNGAGCKVPATDSAEIHAVIDAEADVERAQGALRAEDARSAPADTQAALALSQTRLAQAQAALSDKALDYALPEQRSIRQVEALSEQAKTSVPTAIASNPIIGEIFAQVKLVAAEAVRSNHKKALAGSPAAATAILKGDDAEITKLKSNTGAPLYRADFDDLQSSLRENLLNATSEPDAPATEADGTTAKTPADTANDAAFWGRLKSYYRLYYQGKFTDYFGNTYTKPSVSLTVTDQELGQVVAVFFEFAFDEAGQTPIWKQSPQATENLSSDGSSVVTIALPTGGQLTKQDQMKVTFDDTARPPVTHPLIYPVAATDSTITEVANGIAGTVNSAAISGVSATVATPPNPAALQTTITFKGIANLKAQALAATGTGVTYYPGGNSNEPSFVSIQPNPQVLDISTNECGMTQEKAVIMSALSQGFGSGISSVASGMVGTLGGIDLGLKINIGDNTVLNSLIKATVTEIGQRLTVQALYPVLSADK